VEKDEPGDHMTEADIALMFSMFILLPFFIVPVLFFLRRPICSKCGKKYRITDRAVQFCEKCTYIWQMKMMG
jgi:predicted amidophosphoribosyltransferase